MSADTLGGVVQLINRLQRACGALGENAASEDVAGLLNLWQLLPSIVVIGGQVLSLHQGDGNWAWECSRTLSRTEFNVSDAGCMQCCGHRHRGDAISNGA